MAADRGIDSAGRALSSGVLPAFLILHVSFPSPFRCWSLWEARASHSGKGVREKGTRLASRCLRAARIIHELGHLWLLAGVELTRWSHSSKEGLIAEGQDLRGFCEEVWGRYCTVVRCLFDPFLVSVALTTDESAKCSLCKMGCWVLVPSCSLIFFCLCGPPSCSLLLLSSRPSGTLCLVFFGSCSRCVSSFCPELASLRMRSTKTLAKDPHVSKHHVVFEGVRELQVRSTAILCIFQRGKQDHHERGELWK